MVKNLPGDVFEWYKLHIETQSKDVVTYIVCHMLSFSMPDTNFITNIHTSTGRNSLLALGLRMKACSEQYVTNDYTLDRNTCPYLLLGQSTQQLQRASQERLGVH